MIELIDFIKKIAFRRETKESEADISQRVFRIVSENSSETNSLKNLGEKWGFGSNEARISAWTRLLLKNESPRAPLNKDYFEQSSGNKNDFTVGVNQINLDVRRSFVIGDNFLFEDRKMREFARKDLGIVLQTIFEENKDISYTQGFHELVSIFFHVAGMEASYRISLVVIERYYKDFLYSSFEETKSVLRFCVEIIKMEDRMLFEHLHQNKINGFFSLSWLLTWFSYNKQEIEGILRIFDFIISTNFIMPYYISAAVFV
ncbi:hypothetical protein MHBO_001042 [Bonamia ostreae]|uniref:Rab-GAP TBC domain-containing protein n=1 Tax=Bonamia ostreae TaxID=126728 RepID=A0ABV2AI55_9EUKA